MRIWNNLKWLFNHPPTNVHGLRRGEVLTCDYCGITSVSPYIGSMWKTSDFCICSKCRKKVFDAILKPDEQKGEVKKSDVVPY